MDSEPQQLRALSVQLGDRRIGVINRLAGDRQLFAFEPEYAEDPKRALLSLSFKATSGDLVTRPRTYVARVPPFFSNLLPEGHLRTYLASRAGVKPEREFFLLAALGADLPGAVTVLPLEGDQGAYREVSTSQDGEASDSREQPVLRFSLAGVQLKFSAIAETSGGLTIPANGMGGSWILKLPSARFEAVPENEFAMLELARAVGIEVPEVRLVHPDQVTGLPEGIEQFGGVALAVRRFDRTSDGGRVHLEDFAQVFGLFPERKYEKRSYANIAAILWAEAGPESTYEFVRRLTLAVLTGNADMHLKNWSLLYPDGRIPILSPAYDLVSTVPYLPGGELALTLGSERNLAQITKEQVRRFSETAGLPINPVWQTVRETVERTAQTWPNLEERGRLPQWIDQKVSEHLERVVDSTAVS
ncbi:type II toxin-antitoxin system HipA family toxin [Gemmatimonadota bacterium]